MGSFTRAFLLLLIGINAAIAADDVSKGIEKLNEIYATTAKRAADLTEQVENIVKESDDEIQKILKTFRETVGSTVADAVSSVAHQLTPENAPECLTASEEDLAKLIGSTTEEVSKCLSTPYTSITDSIEDLVAAGHKAAEAASSYAERLEDCDDSSDKVTCVANIGLNVQGTVAELGVANTAEVSKIGAVIAGLQLRIGICTTDAVALAYTKGAEIGLKASSCILNSAAD